MRLAAIIALALAACVAPRHDRGGVRVFAPQPTADEIRALVERYEPAIIARLGTSWSAPYTIRVCRLPSGRVADTNDATRAVRVSERLTGGTPLAEAVLHELVHVHAVGRWEDLPFAVQEGLAHWVSLSLLRGVTEYGGPQPDPAALALALSLSREEFQRREDTSDIEQAATWIASALTKSR